MSRSYREPWMIDSYGSKAKKAWKRLANKKVRRTKNISDGRMFSKVFDQWSIVDWKYKMTSKPHIYYNYFTGKLEEIPGEPEWKIRRK